VSLGPQSRRGRRSRCTLYFGFYLVQLGIVARDEALAMAQQASLSLDLVSRPSDSCVLLGQPLCLPALAAKDF